MAACIAVHATEVLMQCIPQVKHPIIISRSNTRVSLQKSKPSEAAVSAMNHREVKMIQKSLPKFTGLPALKKLSAAGPVIHLSPQPLQAGRTLTPGKIQTDSLITLQVLTQAISLHWHTINAHDLCCNR
jgi:hypothetical protein